MCFRAVDIWAQGAHWITAEKDIPNTKMSELSNVSSVSEVLRQMIWNQAPSYTPLHSLSTSFPPHLSLCLLPVFIVSSSYGPQSRLSMSFSPGHAFPNTPLPSSISSGPNLHHTLEPTTHPLPSVLAGDLVSSCPYLPKWRTSWKKLWSLVPAFPILPPLSICLSSLGGRKVPCALPKMMFLKLGYPPFLSFLGLHSSLIS